MNIGSGRYARVGLGIGLAGLSAAMGASIVTAPLFAWVLAIGAVLVLLLSAPAYYWAIAALVSATLFRPFTALGLAPSYINFFHFPLALLAGILACGKKPYQDAVTRKTGIGILALLLVCVVSWIANEGEVSRPFLEWLVFCEPFLALFAILRTDLTPRMYRASWALVLGIALVQVPVGYWQAINVGLSDDLQGTFIGQGAGAHVAGAVCLLGILICATRGAKTRSMTAKWCWFLTATVLFTIPLLADANQVIVAGVLGLGLALITCLGINPVRLVLPVSAMATVVYFGYLFYEPLHRLSNSDLLRDGIEGKIEGTNLVLSGMWHTPTFGVIGLGPGNSVSRVALMTSGADLKEGSPVALLGLKTAHVTREVEQLTESNYLWKSSSVWSSISSWTGLIGDLGPVGLGIYLWIVAQLWRAVSGSRDWESSVMRGAFLMVCFLGFIYSWLEEPGFTLMLAFIMGLAVHRVRQNAKLAVEPRSEVQLAGGWQPRSSLAYHWQGQP